MSRQGGRVDEAPFGRVAVTLFVVGCMLVVLTGTAAGATYRPQDEVEGTNEGWRRGGHTLFGVFAPTLERVNDELTNSGFGRLDGFYLLFGHGMYSETDRLAVAGIFGSGQADSTKGTKNARFRTGFGAVEVARVWPQDRWHMQLGGILGVGGSSLLLSDGRPTNMDDALSRRYETYLTNAFIVVGPSFGWRTDLTERSALFLKTGYLWTLSSPWTHRSTKARLDGTPDMNSPFFMVGMTYRFGRSTPTYRSTSKKSFCWSYGTKRRCISSDVDVSF